MLNQVLKVSPGTCQQSVEVLSKSVTFFFVFQRSQGTITNVKSKKNTDSGTVQASNETTTSLAQFLSFSSPISPSPLGTRYLCSLTA